MRSAGPDPDRGPDPDLDAAVAAAREQYRRARPVGERLAERARRVLPGGHTRSVLDFAPFPIRVARAAGATLTDVDGHRYLDFCGDYTSGLLGHSPQHVRRAVVEALAEGVALGATHPREIEVAELLCQRFAAVEQVRFCASGTEANLQAIALARHHTGRTGVGVFTGGYHGGVLGVQDSGNPLTVPHRWVRAPYDDIAGLDALLADDDLGCVLVEAVQGNAGCLPASERFLTELRRRTAERGVLLILDEVMTAVLAPGGAQQLFGICPDLTTLGKHLGGGLNFGAFGGRAAVMAAFDSAAGGSLSLAGTFNNNVLTMAAALAVLRHERDDDRLVAANRRGDRLRVELGRVFERAGASLWTTGRGVMVGVHAHDWRWLHCFVHGMLARGHYLGPRGFLSLSVEITDEHVDRFVHDAALWCG